MGKALVLALAEGPCGVTREQAIRIPRGVVCIVNLDTLFESLQFSILGFLVEAF